MVSNYWHSAFLVFAWCPACWGQSLLTSLLCRYAISPSSLLLCGSLPFPRHPFLFHVYFSILARTLKSATLFLIFILAMVSSFFITYPNICFKKLIEITCSWKEVTATIPWGFLRKREVRIGIVLLNVTSHIFLR